MNTLKIFSAKNFIRSCILALGLFFANTAFSQGTYTTQQFWTTGWCNICGPTVGNYACNPPWSGSGTWNNGMRTFVTAIPAGNVVTQVCVLVNKVDCGYTSLCVNINGVVLQCLPPIGNCACGSCWPQTFCATFPCPGGLPGFINNGTNTVQLVQSGGDICVNNAIVSLTYAPCCQIPTITAAANPATICIGKSSTLTASGAGIGGTYTWQPGGIVGSTANVTPAATTIYTVTGTTTANCVGTRTVQVTVLPLPILNPASNSPICAGNTLSLTVGAQSSYTWSGPGAWSSNLQNPTRSPAVGGAYTLIATSPGGCTNQAVVNVIVLPNPTATAVNNGPICAGNNLVLTGGGGGTYSWSGPNGFTSLAPIPVFVNAQPILSGVYSLTVAVGACTGVATTTVLVNPAATPTASSNSPVCLNKQLNLMGLGGTTYTWTGPFGFNSNLQNPVLASAQFSNSGTWTLSVTNGNGCIGTTTINVIVNPLPVPIVNNPLVCQGQPINLTASGGTAYAWSGPLGYSSLVQNPVIPNAQPNMSGGYSVVVTSAFGCTAQAVANVTVLTLPQPTLTSNSPVCTGGILTLFGNGGTSYSWAGPNGFVSGLQNPSILNVPLAASGIYTLTVTVGSCTNNITASITINPLPTPTATSNSPVCLGQPINFTGNGGTTYTWTGPFGYNSNAQNPIIPVAQNTNAGTYTLTVTNGNGCVNFVTTNVVVNPLPVIVVNNPLVCLGQPINLTSNGGVGYSWNGPLGYNSIAQNPSIPNAQLNMSGGYSVIVTSAQGCTAQAVANVTVITLPQPVILSTSPNCVGSTLSFTGSGGATYAWSGPNGFASGFQNPSIPNVQMAANGTYSLIVTAGTCSNIVTANVVINPLPTPTATSNSPVCVGQPINFTGNGGTTYTWTGPGGYTSNAQNPIIAVAQNSNAGVYTLSVTNANGCMNFVTTNVVINPLPIPVVNNPLVCLNQPINLTSNGGVGYSWNGPLGFNSIAQNPSIPNAQLNMSGGYSVIVTSAQGCTAQAVANVTVITLPQPVILSTSPNCVGSTLSFTGSGGATYAWSGPNGFASGFQNPSIPNVQMAANGTYSLIVTAGTCSNIVTANVVINPLPTPNIITNSPVCLLQPINFTGSGGTTYTWTGPGGYSSNSQNPVIAVAQNSNAGTYTLTVTNANGCVNLTTANVVINSLPVIAVNNPTVCLNQPINLTSNGGVGYSWNGPLGYNSIAQNPSIPNAQLNMSGGYSVVVTSAQGCTAQAVANVTVITLPQPTITSSSPNCVGSTLTFTGSGGATYNWSGPNGFASGLQNPNIANVQMAANGTYSLIVTAGTCSNITTANVIINPLPTPTAISNSPVCLLQPINFSGLGGVTYTWTGPGLNSTSQNPIIAVAQNSNAGVFTLSVTNANGCVNFVTTNVAINPLPVIGVNNPTTCVGTNINLTSNGGTGYSWSGQLGFASIAQNPVIPNAQVNMSGPYTVTVTSAQGCTAQAVAQVSVTALPTPVAGNNGPKCVGQTLQLTSNSGTSYSWIGPNGFMSAAQNPVIGNVQMAANGVYTVTATANLCSNTATVNVVINALPLPNIISNSPVCLLQPIIFQGAGGTTYTWSGPGGYNSTAQNPTIAVAQNTNGGTYTLSVTDVNTCSNFITSNVVINPLPNVSANGAASCSNTPINISAFGANTYVWSGPNGFTSGLQNPVIPVASMLHAGQYTVVGTSAQGCTNTAMCNVTVIALPVPSITANDVCIGDNLVMIGNGGTGYSWAGPNSFTANTSAPSIPNAPLAASGIYTMVATIGPCSGSTTKSITVHPLPTPTLSSNSPICRKEPIQLIGSGGNAYAWVGPNQYQGFGTNVIIPGAILANAGTYTATATDQYGCVNVATLAIVINDLPVVGTKGSTICAGATMTLAAAGGVGFTWAGPQGFSASGATVNAANVTIDMAGDYTVTATDANGCKEYAPASVSINPTPPLAITANAPICAGETLSLTATSSNVVLYYWYGPLNWWSTQQNPPIRDLQADASGIYTVHVHDALGCTTTATMNVLVRNAPTVNIASDKLKGCVPLCVNLTPINSSELESLTWEFGDGNIAVGMNASSCYNNAGAYFIKTTATDKYGCKNIANLAIEAYPIPVADFNFAPTKPLTNEMIDFRDASHEANVTKWTWYFSDKGNNITTGNEVSRSFENAGNYQAVLIAVSDHGCRDTVVKEVMVGEDFGLYVPDAFTPNGDGVNDTFQPKGHGIAKYELNIFDRWGERLFTSTDFEIGWDGTFPKRAVEDLKQDVYVWKIKIVTVQGKSEDFAGKVSLIK